MHMIEFHAAVLAWYLYMSFRTPLPRSGGLSPGVGGMPLHYAIEVNCKNAAVTDIKEQVPSNWAKGCMLVNCYPSMMTGEGHCILLLLNCNKLDSFALSNCMQYIIFCCFPKILHASPAIS